MNKLLQSIKGIISIEERQAARDFGIKVGGAASFALALGLTCSAFAEAVALPTTGVNVGDYLTAGITAVAAVIGIAVGGYIAFMVVKKALRWAGKAMG